MIEKLVRENIKKLKPYTSARDMYSEGILLDANENSLGSTARDFESLHLNRYPDPHQKDLREAVGNYTSVPSENLFFGVGSDEIIDLLIRIFCEPEKDSVMIVDPTYGMYQVACDINNVKTISVNLNSEFQIDYDNIFMHYSPSVKMIFLCSPNNPTGNILNRADIIETCRKYNAIVVVDEAYIDFADGGSVIKDIVNNPNLVVLRTFSKAWGLAGIRLGYCAADNKIINYLFKVKAPYNISSLTRSVVLDALNCNDKKEAFVQELVTERERIKVELERIAGVQKVFNSDANFLLFKCTNARQVQKKLAELGIIIRDRSSYIMLEDCLRLSVGTTNENNKFLESLKQVL